MEESHEMTGSLFLLRKNSEELKCKEVQAVNGKDNCSTHKNKSIYQNT